MMATALGQRFNAVRDVRRTFRAGLWLLVSRSPPYWLLLWHVGDAHARLRPVGGARQPGPDVPPRLHVVRPRPWLLFQLLRNFVAALERPRVVLWLSIAGIALNALLSWALIFGHFGLPALGLAGGGIGSTLTWLIMCVALIAVVSRRPAVPALPSVRPLVAVRRRADAGDGPARLADRRSTHGARDGRVRARRLTSWAGSARRRSPPTPSRCSSPR